MRLYVEGSTWVKATTRRNRAGFPPTEIARSSTRSPEHGSVFRCGESRGIVRTRRLMSNGFAGVDSCSSRRAVKRRHHLKKRTIVRRHARNCKVCNEENDALHPVTPWSSAPATAGWGTRADAAREEKTSPLEFFAVKKRDSRRFLKKRLRFRCEGPVRIA
jgi:hypothetical protein